MKQDNPQVIEGEVLASSQQQDVSESSPSLKTSQIEFKPRAPSEGKLPDKKRKKLTLPEDSFCRHYVKMGFNATEAYLKVKPKVLRETATVKGFMYLQKPRVQDRIIQIINSSELKELEIINKALESKTPDQISWKEIHSFTRTALELKGKLNKAGPQTKVNIGLVVER